MGEEELSRLQRGQRVDSGQGCARPFRRRMRETYGIDSVSGMSTRAWGTSGPKRCSSTLRRIDSSGNGNWILYSNRRRRAVSRTSARLVRGDDRG